MKKENIITLGMLGLTLTLIVKKRKSKKSLGIGTISKNSISENPEFEKFLDSVLENRINPKYFEFQVNPNILKVLTNLIGYNIEHVIVRPRDIRHILNRHYQDREKGKLNEPLKKEDLMKIPYLINGGGLRLEVNTNTSTAKAINFCRREDKNNLIGVEITWTTNGSLPDNSVCIKTMWKEK